LVFIRRQLLPTTAENKNAILFEPQNFQTFGSESTRGRESNKKEGAKVKIWQFEAKNKKKLKKWVEPIFCTPQ
jgi:hypothetical protein